VQAMQRTPLSLWQQALKDAVEETDPLLVHAKAADAEIAIFNRMHGFVANADSNEEQAMFEALVTIRALKTLRSQSTGASSAKLASPYAHSG
jgi:hypothetical protein